MASGVRVGEGSVCWAAAITMTSFGYRLIRFFGGSAHDFSLISLLTVVDAEVRIIEIFMFATDADNPTIRESGACITDAFETPDWLGQ